MNSLSKQVNPKFNFYLNFNINEFNNEQKKSIMHKDMRYAMEKLPIKFSIDFVGIIELQINLVNLKIIAHRITESRCPYSQGVISVKIYTIFFCH